MAYKGALFWLDNCPAESIVGCDVYLPMLQPLRLFPQVIMEPFFLTSRLQTHHTVTKPTGNHRNMDSLADLVNSTGKNITMTQ